jgi:FKBP-type peptidyl-prolyl cis-trans isomerase
MFKYILGIASVLLLVASCTTDESPFLTQPEREEIILQEYFAENNITGLQKTASGMYHLTLENGNDTLLPKDSIIYIGYEGRLLYGYIFDSSFLRGDTFMVQNGSARIVSEFESISCDTMPVTKQVVCDTCPVFGGSVIAGWREAIALLEKGEKKRFYIPSGLAYGTRGSGNNIPANSVLVFDIKAYGYVGIQDSCQSR